MSQPIRRTDSYLGSTPSARRRQIPSRGTKRLGLESLEPRQLFAAVQIIPIADNTLYESATGSLSNGAGESLFVEQAASQAGVRRGLVKFDIGAAVPNGSQIDSVTLSLHMSKAISGARDIALHEVLADWGEGTSNASSNEGAGTSATANSATWLHRFFSQTLWTQAGGDFDSTASATSSVTGVGSYQWTNTRMAADVQQWLDHPNTQFGWLVKEVGESVEGTAKRFDSRESSTASFRPLLTIQYSAPHQAPTVAHPIARHYTVTGQAFDFSVPVDTFHDEDATLGYAARRTDGASLPNWLAFDPATRTFHGVPQNADATIVELSVLATDSAQPPLTTQTDFTLIVARASAPWQNPVQPLDVDLDGFIVPPLRRFGV